MYIYIIYMTDYKILYLEDFYNKNLKYNMKYKTCK